MTDLSRALGYLFALVLIGIGALAGGCSLIFTPELFRAGEFSGGGIFPTWLLGLGIAALGIGGGIMIFMALARTSDALPVEDFTPDPDEAPPEPTAEPKPDAPDAPTDRPS